MSRWLTRFWAQLTLTPDRLRRLQIAAIGSAVASVLLLSIGWMRLTRVRAEAEAYRASVLAPPAQPELPLEERMLLETVQKIAAQLTSVPNAQAFAISQLSRVAQQQGLIVTGVETTEQPGAPNTPNSTSDWQTRLLRFRLNGSSSQVLRWLQSLEGMPLVIKLTGVQISADSSASKGVSAVVEMEILLPPVQGGTQR